MEPAPTPLTPSTKSSYGSVFSIIMIVVILVVGAFYVWNKRVAQNYQYATPGEPAAEEALPDGQ